MTSKLRRPPAPSRTAFVLLTLTMTLFGYLASEAAVVLPSVSAALGLDAAQAGLLVSARFFGGIIAGTLMFVLRDRVAFRGYIVVGTILTAASVVLLPFAKSYAAAMAISLLRGPAMTFMVTTTNGALSSWFWRFAGRWSQRVHSFVGVGLIAAPVVGIAVELAGLPWQFVWAGPIVLVPFVLWAAARAPAGRHVRGVPAVTHETGPTGRVPAGALAIAAAPCALLGFANVGTEGVILGWTQTYIVSAGNVVLPDAAFTLAVALGILVGRAFAGRVADRLGLRNLYHILLGAIGALGLLIWFVPAARVPAALLLGLAMSGLYPLLMSRVGPLARATHGRLYPVMEIVGTLGGTALPALVGVLAVRSPTDGYPLVLLGGTAAMLLISLTLEPLGRRLLRR